MPHGQNCTIRNCRRKIKIFLFLPYKIERLVSVVFYQEEIKLKSPSADTNKISAVDKNFWLKIKLD